MNIFLKSKWSVTVFFILICVGSVLSFRFFRPDPGELLKKRTAERSKGSPSAKIWITEYFDYQCPPCAVAHKLLDQKIKETPGKIYLQVRYHPMPAHQNAVAAAVHAECASRQKGKFWKFHELLFQNQADWAKDPYAPLKFLKYGEEAGLDLKSWDVCTKDPAIEKLVLEEKAKGETLGVKLTPTFFVNGKIAVGNNAMIEELKKIEDPNTPSS